MGRGILRGAGGDENLKSNFIWPYLEIFISPALSCLRTSQTLQLKSSYPPSNRRPDLEKATDVIPQMMLSWEYIPISWSARISNNRHVASSDPVAKAYPLGKYWKIDHQDYLTWIFIRAFFIQFQIDKAWISFHHNLNTYCDSINIRFMSRKCLLAHSIPYIPEL